VASAYVRALGGEGDGTAGGRIGGNGATGEGRTGRNWATGATGTRRAEGGEGDDGDADDEGGGCCEFEKFKPGGMIACSDG
jgi:hypothetical protein